MLKDDDIIRIQREIDAKNTPKVEIAEDGALTVAEWLARDLPDADRLLGAWITGTDKVLIIGPTGLGKTMLGFAVAFAVSTGKDFLHWQAFRRGRVLYVDGEMSRRLLKDRLRDAARRADAQPGGLLILSKEDFEDMPPLNTEAGQRWMDSFIEMHGPFDLMILDNIQALLVGDMKDEAQWSEMLPWVKSLTRRSIGQIWFHHTGHNESRSYGSKAREWGMDTVILMEKVEAPGTDVAFAINFTKARTRTPDNRADFEPITMKLQGDAWSHSEIVTGCEKLSQNAQTVFRLLTEAGSHGLSTEEWNTKAKALGIGEKRRATLSDIHAQLKARGMVHSYADRWYVTRQDGRPNLNLVVDNSTKEIDDD